MQSVPVTLPDLLRHAAALNPCGEAVVDALWRCGHTELPTQVTRMGALLHRCGVRKGDRVALLMPPSTAHLVALFGAIELGAVPCALHVRESEEVLLALLERLSPRALVYDAAYSDRVHRLRARAPFVTAAVGAISPLTPADAAGGGSDPVIPHDLAAVAADHEFMPAVADDPAAIVLSSGTTGLPKGVMHTHRTLLASARCGSRYMAACPRAACLNTFTTAFIGWYNLTLPFLYGGARIVYLPQWDPAGVLRTIERENITGCFLVPTMWRMVLQALQAGEYELGSLELIGYAGEPMDARTMTELRARVCPQVINTYGTTESGSWGGCTVMQPQDIAAGSRIDSVGRAGAEVQIRIVRPGGPIDVALPAREEGEVVIRGPSVASQLWEQPALARRIFDRGWWRSGDMGYMDDAGFLYLKGRVDDMIISGGINIFPAEVEAAVLSHPAVRECAVIGLPSDRWGQEVTAFVIAAPDLDAAQLDAHLATTSLAAFKRPRAYRFVEQLPRGNTGKVSRRLLKQELAQG